MRLKSLLIGLLYFCAQAAYAESTALEVLSLPEDGRSPPAVIGDISWLAGRWVGEGLGGAAEDIIAPPSGGQMMGMFRHSKADGMVNFYEFYVFAELEGSLTQRLKHFSPMLMGWEDKDGFVEFPLVAIDDGAAWFDGLSYRLEEDGSLTVAVRLDEENVAQVRYQRAD